MKQTAPWASPWLVPRTTSACLGGEGTLLRADGEEEGLQIAWKMDTEGRSGPQHQTRFDSAVKM